MVSAFSPKKIIENQLYMHNFNGKVGIYFFREIAIALCLTYPLLVRGDILFWLGMVCSCISACYTVLRIYHEFIKRNSRDRDAAKKKS
jgi:hypothetical protein